MSNNLLKSYLWVKYSLEKKKYDNLKKQVWNCISTNNKYSLNKKKEYSDSSDEEFFNDSVNNEYPDYQEYSYYQNKNINYDQMSLLSGSTTIGTIGTNNERLSKLQKWINSDSDKYSLQKIKEYIFNILLLNNLDNNITEQVLKYSINTYSNIYAYYKKNDKVLKNPIKSAFIVLIIKNAIFEITKKEISNNTILKHIDYDNQKIKNKIPEANIILNNIFNNADK